MADKKPTFDFSKLNFDFASQGFNFTNPDGSSMITAVTSQLGGLLGRSSGYLETLPKVVQNRVKALENLDSKFHEYEEEFEKEVKALELKYHNEKYKPLFARRAEIVSGKSEPTEEELKDDEEDEEEGGAEQQQEEEQGKEQGEEAKKEETEEEKNVKGVPDFWLTAIKHHELFESLITEKDEDVLKHLMDVVFEPLEGDDDGSFTLHFHFRENPYFTNEVLSKTYHLEGDNPEEVVCESVESTKINWKEDKDVTKGVRKEISPEGSFFVFFSPPEVKKGKPPSQKVINAMGLDFELAVALKDEIVPHAVDWFTGTANLEAEMMGDDDDEDGEGQEFNEEDYNSEDDEDFTPAEGEGKQECKQQ